MPCICSQSIKKCFPALPLSHFNGPYDISVIIKEINGHFPFDNLIGFRFTNRMPVRTDVSLFTKYDHTLVENILSRAV